MITVQSKVLAALVALLVTLCLVAGTLLATATAQAGSLIVSTEAPPPLRTEHAPPPRDGYVWAPGHWEWNSRSYVWTSGAWIVARAKARWVADSWEQVGTEWHYTPGHWER